VSEESKVEFIFGQWSGYLGTQTKFSPRGGRYKTTPPSQQFNPSKADFFIGFHIFPNIIEGIPK
jgi:hypothetical protein